jgi:hypothetical protein
MQLAFAQDFTVSLDVKPEYYATKTDYIKLTINNPSESDWFTIVVMGFPQEWVTTQTSILQVPAIGSNSMLIEVKPARDVLPGMFQYFLKVKSVNTGSEFEKNLLINIQQVTSAILKDVALSCETCIDNVDVSGTVYNVGSKDLDLTLVIKVADQQKIFSIGKLNVRDKKEFKTSFSLKDMSPGSYVMEFNLIDIEGKSLYTDSKTFKIPSIENVIYDKQISPTPFGSLITVSAINKGNVVSTIDLSSNVPKDWYYFISGPSPTGMAIGHYYWRTELNPGESTSLKYSEIYWPTYVLIVAVVLVGIFVYWQSTAVAFTKNVIGRPSIKAGRDFSISLHVRSRRRDISRVAVRDVVPSDFSIVSKFETIKPVIRKIASGIELVWRVGDLKPHEERVLHYTIKPTQEIPRRVSLPSALVKGVKGKGLFVKRSNRISLHPEYDETKIVTVKVSK